MTIRLRVLMPLFLAATSFSCLQVQSEKRSLDEQTPTSPGTLAPSVDDARKGIRETTTTEPFQDDETAELPPKAVDSFKVLFHDQHHQGTLPIASVKQHLLQYIEESAPKDKPKLPGLLAKLDSGIIDVFISNLAQLDPNYLSSPNLVHLAIPLGGQFQVRIGNDFIAADLIKFDQISMINHQLNRKAKNAFEKLQQEFIKAFPNNRLHFYQGYRSYNEQETLYKKQVETKGSAVGVAKPGSSKHQLGFAVDLYYADSKNTIIWSWPIEVVKWLELHGPEFGIVHPMPQFDPPHYEAIGAIHPQLISAMRQSGLNIHDHYDINIAMLAIFNKLRE